MDSSDTLQIVILVILLALSAFFSSTETALTSVNKIRIRSLAEDGNKRARIVKQLTDDPAKMLSTILIGNNIVNLSASALTTVLATNIAGRLGMGSASGRIVGLGTGILTILVLIFGEITPKSAATIHAERISLRNGPIILWLSRILTPVIVIINALSAGVMRLMGINPDSEAAPMTEDDLLTVIDVSHEDGVIESEEREMITNVVDFGDSEASDVMVPRIDVTFLDVEADYEEVISLFREEKYTRIPVYENDKDHVVGILNLKDVFCFTGAPDDFHIADIMRKPHFVYEFQKTSDLMMQMQSKSINMIIVLDEYGAVAGIATMEDLIEEIVGEIRDEYDEEEIDDIRKTSTGDYIVDGNVKLDDINDLLGLEIETDDYDSLAGHVIHELGHIPSAGESITIGSIRFIVRKMDKNRIDTIFIKMPDTSEKDENI